MFTSESGISMRKKGDTHAAFRKTSKWRQFRQRMRKKQRVDWVTGSPLSSTWNLHHLNPWDYENLSEEMFVGLNFQTHEVIHWFWGYEDAPRDWKKRIKKVTELLELMDTYKYKSIIKD